MPQFRDALKQGDEALTQFVARRYENVGWKSAEILEDLKNTDDLYASEVC